MINIQKKIGNIGDSIICILNKKTDIKDLTENKDLINQKTFKNKVKEIISSISQEISLNILIQ